MASGIGSAVSNAVSFVRNMASNIGAAVRGAINFFLEMPRRIMGALSGLGSQLVGVGRNLMQGFVNGVTGMASRLVASVTAPIKDAINGAKSLLGIHSPSRVFRQIGDYVGQGLEQGLKGSTSGVLAASKRMSNAIGQAFESRQISEGAAHNAYLTINAGTKQLLDAASRRASVASRLKAANTALTKATKTRDDYRNTVSEGLSKFDVSKATSSGNLLQTLRNRVAQTKTFTTVMSKLRKAGLDATSYQQFIASGVDALPLAQQLLSGGSSQIKEVASLQGQLGKASSAFATSAANDLYGAGVNAAQGLVKGLQSQQAALDKQMKKIADSMTNAIKRNLGIHSPSRVMRDEVGAMMGAGIAEGIAQSARSINNAVTGTLTSARVVGVKGASRSTSSDVAQHTPTTVDRSFKAPITINEAKDPLGSAGRIGAELDKWGRM
jgi:phage-related protein